MECGVLYPKLRLCGVMFRAVAGGLVLLVK